MPETVPETKPVWWSKINIVAALTFLAGVLQLAADQDWTTADVDKFLLAGVGAITFILRTWFTSTALTVTVTKAAPLIMIAVLLAPLTALADDVFVKGLDPAKEYSLARGADGRWAAVPLVSITAAGAPSPGPTDPAPTAVASRAKALTQEAITSGGTQNTAVALSAVYSLVSDQVNSGKVLPGDAMPAAKFLADQIIPTAEVPKWTKCRTGIAVLVAEEQQAGRFGTKAQVTAGLKSISDGMKLAVEANAKPGEAIDWKKWFDILWPILQKLLEQWLGMAER